MYKADVFVFYDDVQYDRHGWRNRNRIKTPHGPQWLTIPVKSVGSTWKEARICDMRISWDKQWNRAHFESLRQSYVRAPFFKQYEPMLHRWYGKQPRNLSDFTIDTAVELSRELGIERTQFLRSSNLGCDGCKTDRLVALLKKLGATTYISGPAAKEYLDTARLNAGGISVEWMVYDYPEYPQLYPPFDAHLSALDLLLMVGPDAGRYIWCKPSKA